MITPVAIAGGYVKATSFEVNCHGDMMGATLCLHRVRELVIASLRELHLALHTVGAYKIHLEGKPVGGHLYV